MKIEQSKFFKSYGYAVILGVVTFFGAIGIYFFIISPLYTNTQKSGVELSVKEKEYESLQAKKSKLDSLKGKQEELKKQAAVVSNALPKEEDVGRLFIQLDGLVRASSGTLKSVTTVSVNTNTGDTANLAAAGITKTVFTLPLELPSYFDLKSFISDSKSALRLLSISDFNISATDSGALNVNLTANSYTRN